ncbi:MAG: ArnT family glycosyltransferase [Rhizomicrobium sp.]
MDAAGHLRAAPKRASWLNLSSVDTDRAVLALIVAGTVVRLAFAAATGLGTDESYTVANARLLDLSYVDYPPLHVWLVGTWSWLCHSEAPLVVRLPFIALFAGSTWLMYRLTTLLFHARAGMWAAILFNLAPVFTIPHASWVLPDGPLIFLLLCGALTLSHLLFDTAFPSASWRGWLLAGCFAGLAMLTKYHGALLPAGTLVFLLSWAPGRKLLSTPGPWIAAAAAAILFTPVLLWNAQHDWAGLFFQTKRLTGATNLSLMRVVTGVAGQAAYLSPWLFVAMTAVWIAALRRNVREPRAWFLALLASGPIIGFTAADLVAKGLPHWPMPGWLFVLPLLGVQAAAFAKRRPQAAAIATGMIAVLLVAVTGVIGTDVRSGWLGGMLPGKEADPTLDLVSWTGVTTALAQRGLLDGSTPAVAATHWMDAGKLNLTVGRSIPVLCLCADPQQFRYSSDPGRFAGRNILILSRHKDLQIPQNTLGGEFAGFEPLAPIILKRGGEPALEITVVRGLHFRPGAALAAHATSGHAAADGL